MRTHKTWRPQVIAALERFGHTPTKALEIAIDAERGDLHAVKWVARATDYPFVEDGMYCATCDRREQDELFLDTETCSVCGGFLDVLDADTIEADQGQFGVGA